MSIELLFKVLHNKSRLLSLNRFRVWPCSPVKLNVNNREESMSSYPFRILNCVWSREDPEKTSSIQMI